MSRWECESGHVLEGLFYGDVKNVDLTSMPVTPLTVTCPKCRSEMLLSREEGAKELLKRIREFVGKASRHPDYRADSSDVMNDLGRSETSVRRLADDALRP